jgi:hypothetical protein
MSCNYAAIMKCFMTAGLTFSMSLKCGWCAGERQGWEALGRKVCSESVRARGSPEPGLPLELKDAAGVGPQGGVAQCVEALEGGYSKGLRKVLSGYCPPPSEGSAAFERAESPPCSI